MERDLTNATFMGVCSGLAKEFEVKPITVRLIFIIATLMGFGLPILLYFILALISD